MRPRPTRYDDTVIRAAAEAMAPRVLRWMELGHEEAELEDVVADLVKAMDFDNGGYALARSLDEYSPDAELVKILDRAGVEIHSALQTACEAWVIETGAVAPALESRVMAVKHPDYGVGIVTHNYPDGRASVYLESLGHVRTGVGTHGRVIEWELLTPVAESEVTNAASR